MAKIQLNNGLIAEYKQLKVSCSDKEWQSVLQGFAYLTPSYAMNKANAAAKEAVREFGGTILELDPPVKSPPMYGRA